MSSDKEDREFIAFLRSRNLVLLAAGYERALKRKIQRRRAKRRGKK